MRLEIDIPKHQYNNIMEIDSINLGRVSYKGIIMYAINAIKRGKALEQEPRIGHWIDTNYHHYYDDGDIETTELRCSCCNKEVEWDIELLHKPYYCENCGADMREVEE